jgi:creatinine amidohydrolase
MTSRFLPLDCIRGFLGVLSALFLLFSSPLAHSEEPPPTQSNPLAASTSLELEKMTWLEVRDRIQAGARRVIIPTGGIEQSGPFVALNKHDLIAREVSVRSARILGDTLVAPTVSFVPEGEVSPPTGHMRFSGTISVKPATLQILLEDVASSLAAHGFTEIILVGDSGDTQATLLTTANTLSASTKLSAKVRYLPQFYNYSDVDDFLARKGIKTGTEEFHEDAAVSLQLLVIDPDAMRYQERMRIGRTKLDGLSLENREALVALGKEILSLRAERVAEAIRGEPKR